MDANFFESYRKEFPVTRNYIYLDHAGVSPVSLRVKGVIEAFLAESCEGGGFHYPKWATRISEIRQASSRLINADFGEIAFIKNTSHGLSIVAEGLDWKLGDNVLVYEKEFPSNLYPWLNLKRKGVEVRLIPSREGRVSLDDIARLIDAKTRLLAVSSVQFANGFRLDLERTGELCRERSVLFCVDAIQSLGVLPMDVRRSHIDFLSADAHKWLLGPEGIGVFFCRRELAERVSPLLTGWKCVQSEFDFDHPDFCLKRDALKFEEGSMNLLGIFGLGAALDLLFEAGIGNIENRVQGLGDVIIREAEQRGFRILTPKERMNRGGSITFAGDFDPTILRDALRGEGIMVNARGGGLRISPHFYNTEAELMVLFERIGQLQGR